MESLLSTQASSHSRSSAAYPPESRYYSYSSQAVSRVPDSAKRRLVSYMNSTGIREGMLLNFGNVRRLEWRVNSP